MTDKKPKRPRKSSNRRNVAPQSPRFLPSSQMVGEKSASPAPAKAKKSKKPKKKKTVNYNTRGKGIKIIKCGFGKGRRTSKSCRN